MANLTLLGARVDLEGLCLWCGGFLPKLFVGPMEGILSNLLGLWGLGAQICEKMTKPWKFGQLA